MIAVRARVIVGHGMGVDRAGPGGVTTDIGVVVGDAWQGRGAGTALIRTLVSRAQARGAAVVTMDVLHGNERVMSMITSQWPRARTTLSPDGMTVGIQLPRRRPDPAGRCGATLRRRARPAGRPRAATRFGR